MLNMYLGILILWAVCSMIYAGGPNIRGPTARRRYSYGKSIQNIIIILHCITFSMHTDDSQTQTNIIKNV